MESLVTTDMTNRRTVTERRRNHQSLFTSFQFRGRRKAFRRPEDSSKFFLDHHDRRLLFPSAVILILCLADALITLKLIQHGATEVNLVMRLLIEEGVVAFIVTKYLMTAVSLVWLVAHNNFRIFNSIKVHHLIYSCAGLYISLLAYEIFLMQQVKLTASL